MYDITPYILINNEKLRSFKSKENIHKPADYFVLISDQSKTVKTRQHLQRRNAPCELGG